MTAQEALKIEELDPVCMMAPDTLERKFQEYIQRLKSQYPKPDSLGNDYWYGYWAITMIRMELAIGTSYVTLLVNSDEDEVEKITLFGFPDYGS